MFSFLSCKCISRCIKTYCKHRIDSEVIADLRFSASKSSPLPPKILVPATLVPLPQFRDVICVALPMQHTCNTHATHMQHTCNTTCNTSLFLGNFQEKCPRGWKSTFSILRLGLGWKCQILHVDCKFTGKMLVLHVVLHVCCMCVACVLHVRCMGRATQITSLNWGSGTSVAGTRILGGRREILEAENLKSAITSESILCVQYVLMHLEMHNVSQCPRGQKGQEAEKQTKGWMLFCVFLSPGRVFSVSSLFQHRHTDTERICVCKKTGNKKNSPRVLQKKQPSTGNTIDADITPVAPNFNVVLGSAEHYEQKWLFFSKAAIHIIQSTTLNWGTGGTWRVWS